MFSDYVFLAAFLIGIISGLRSLTAPAVVAWSVQFHWISLRGTLLAFLGSWPAVGVFTFFAITEYLADKLPRTPPRTLYLDVDYYDLRARDYPLLAPSAMAERLWKVAELFPPNPGFEFAIYHKRRP